MLPDINTQTYKQIITTKNVIAFIGAAVGIALFFMGQILKHHFSLPDAAAKVFAVIAAVILIVAILFFLGFVTNPRYKEHKDEYVKALSEEKSRERKRYIFSRNYMLLAGLFSLAVVFKTLDEILPDFLAVTFSFRGIAAIIFNLFPIVMPVLAVIGDVSVFREKGPFMDIAAMYSKMTVITTLMSVLQSLAYDDPINPTLIAMDVLQIVIIFYVGICIDKVKQSKDKEL